MKRLFVSMMELASKQLDMDFSLWSTACKGEWICLFG